jgi:flagella basal body P-ring formation protein FlgA
MTAFLLLATACLPIEGEKILARDMARAWAAFASVEAETAIGYAPAPGVRRRFEAAELGRLAARHGVPDPPGGICFERPTMTLDRAQLLEVLERALGVAGARIALEDFSRHPAPLGDVVFPRQWLRAPAPGAPAAVLWRGYVRYAGARRFPIWARVRITAPLTRVRAVETLRMGEAIQAGQLTLEAGEGFPAAGRDAESVEQVAGRRPQRTIPAGSIVPLALLDQPREVERGDAVRVEVASGAARLSFTGRAESAGSVGETVRVRNMEANRTFAARVAAKGAVEVEAQK